MSWHWYAPEGGTRVTFSGDAALKLRNHVVEAFSSAQETAHEVGGLLFGLVEQHYPLAVRIEGFEEISCEHLYGPSYVLSETDHMGLKEVLARRRLEYSPAIIGFYRSYVGREPFIDSADRELFSTYFWNRASVHLLLKPISTTECYATFRLGEESPAKPLNPLFVFYEGMADAREKAAAAVAAQSAIRLVREAPGPAAQSAVQTAPGAPPQVADAAFPSVPEAPPEVAETAVPPAPEPPAPLAPETPPPEPPPVAKVPHPVIQLPILHRMPSEEEESRRRIHVLLDEFEPDGTGMPEAPEPSTQVPSGPDETAPEVMASKGAITGPPAAAAPATEPPPIANTPRPVIELPAAHRRLRQEEEAGATVNEVHFRLLDEAEPEKAASQPRFWLPWVGCIILSIAAALVYEWWTVGRVQDRASVSPPPRPAATTPQTSLLKTPAPQTAVDTPKEVAGARQPAASPDTPEPAAPAPAAPKPAPSKPREPRSARDSASRSAAIAVPPAVLHEVQPGISPGIRARISDRIVIPVRVKVSVNGGVLGAVPEGQEHDDGLYRYLATRAAQAALSWKFSPAKSTDGTRVAADKTVYFVFAP